jgi:Protein of unknown function (DUF3102)
MATQTDSNQPAVIEQGGELLPADLAAEANRYWRLTERGYRSTLEHAWHTGRALKAARAACPHGEWLPWLAANFEGGERNAQRCMRLAEAYPDGWPEGLRVSLDRALKHLDAPKSDGAAADLPPNGGQVDPAEAEAAKQKLAKVSLLDNVCDWAAEVEVEKAAAASTAAELGGYAESVAAAGKALAELRKGLKRYAKVLRDGEQADREQDVAAWLAEYGESTKREIASRVGLSEADAWEALQGLKRARRVKVVRRKQDDGSWLSLWKASES